MNKDEKICPRCAETIKRAAVVCRYCGHEFGSESASDSAAPEPAASTWLPTPPKGHEQVQSNKGPNKAAQTALGCLGIVVLLALAGQCAGPSSESDSSASDRKLESTTNAEPINSLDDIDGPDSDWSVSTQMDQVRGKPIHYARVTSENEVQFDFPYAGGSRLMITVRRHPNWGDDVLFQISDGQFVCGIDNCSGAINFGSGPETLTLSEPADHDSKTLFATYGPAIIRKLESSERVTVELPFYQEGNRQFTFETKGLVWPPKQPDVTK